MTDSSLSRLRRANPVPQVRRLDAPELLTEITSLPPDVRLMGPMVGRRAPYRRPVVVLAVALAVTALVASTALAVSNWLGGGVAVKPPVTRNEYLRATASADPASRRHLAHYYLAPPNTLTGRGGGGGMAVLISQNAWECYWVRAIRAGDTAAERQARSELGALLDDNVLVAPNGAPENWTPPNPPSTPYAVFADDGGLQWIRSAYAEAAAGHAQKLIDSCRANAPS